MNEPYTALAYAYDLLMQDTEYGRWADYLSDMLSECGVPGTGSVIEFGCGSGAVTIHMVQKGYRVIGIDQSAEMLDCAQKNARQNALSIPFVCADMTSFRTEKRFDGALCVCDGVNYLTDGKTLSLFLENVYAQLKPGGCFLFDISSAHKIKNILGNRFFYEDRDELTYFWQNTYDPERKIAKMDLTMFFADQDVYKRYDEFHEQRAWELDEITLALENAGFSEIHSYGFLTHKAAASAAERIQFSARKE